MPPASGPGSGLSGFLSPLFQLLVGIKNARWAETLSQSDIPSDKQPQPCLLFTLMTPEQRESQHHGEIFLSFFKSTTTYPK